MKTFVLTLLIIQSFLLVSNGQVPSTNKEIVEIESILKKSQADYEAAQKKIYRAEEKLNHLKKIGVLSYNDLTNKEQLLSKAKHKLKEMRLLIQHNNTLVKQTKTNPSFGKSVRSNSNIAQSNVAKSQKKSIQDIQNEKIQKLRDQQKQALVNTVNKKRKDINTQKKNKVKPKQKQQHKKSNPNAAKNKHN